jgi:hypothetical protein
VILYGIKYFMPLRITTDHEHAGMDVSVFRERSVHIDIDDDHLDRTLPDVPPEALARGADSQHSLAHSESLLPSIHGHLQRVSTARTHVGDDQRASGVHGPPGASSSSATILMDALASRDHGEDPLRPEEPGEVEVLLDDLRRSFAPSAVGTPQQHSFAPPDATRFHPSSSTHHSPRQTEP